MVKLAPAQEKGQSVIWIKETIADYVRARLGGPRLPRRKGFDAISQSVRRRDKSKDRNCRCIGSCMARWKLKVVSHTPQAAQCSAHRQLHRDCQACCERRRIRFGLFIFRFRL